MVATKITALPPSTELSLQDYFPDVSAGANVKVTLADLAAYLTGAATPAVATARYAPNRLYATGYANLTGCMMFVNVNLLRTATGTLSGYVGTEIIGGSPAVSRIDYAISGPNGVYQSLFLMVPPGSWYRVTSDSSHTPISWFETLLRPLQV
jgi:uncharacterized membrane protein YuzA (DUF378 family)